MGRHRSAHHGGFPGAHERLHSPQQTGKPLSRPADYFSERLRSFRLCGTHRRRGGRCKTGDCWKPLPGRGPRSDQGGERSHSRSRCRACTYATRGGAGAGGNPAHRCRGRSASFPEPAPLFATGRDRAFICCPRSRFGSAVGFPCGGIGAWDPWAEGCRTASGGRPRGPFGCPSGPFCSSRANDLAGGNPPPCRATGSAYGGPSFIRATDDAPPGRSSGDTSSDPATGRPDSAFSSLRVAGPAPFVRAAHDAPPGRSAGDAPPGAANGGPGSAFSSIHAAGAAPFRSPARDVPSRRATSLAGSDPSSSGPQAGRPR